VRAQHLRCSAGRACALATLPGSTAIRRGGNPIHSDQPSEPLPAELAPFLAAARQELEAATDGLAPHEAIEHLESTMAEAEAQASRLGLAISPPAVLAAQGAPLNESDSPVVVIRQMVDGSHG